MSLTLSEQHQGEGMAYICELSTGQTVYLDNQGSQTLLVVSLSSPGQQQQSSSSFQTGAWLSAPCAFNTGQGILIRITTAQSESYIQIQGNSMSLMVGAPNTASFTPLQLKEGTFPSAHTSAPGAAGMDSMPDIEPMQPMDPMKPMQPMQMGNMQMGMNPMQMRMGNMSMSMGHTNGHNNGHTNGHTNGHVTGHATSQSSSSNGSRVSTSVSVQQQAQQPSNSAQTRKFCNQCGSGISLSDRFCSSCGNSLQ